MFMTNRLVKAIFGKTNHPNLMTSHGTTLKNYHFVIYNNRISHFGVFLCLM